MLMTPEMFSITDDCLCYAVDAFDERARAFRNVVRRGTAAPQSIEDVRAGPPLIRFSQKMREETTALKRFLHANLYRHYQVNRMRVKASRIVHELFDAFMTDPVLLPPDYQVASGDTMKQARKIADYIAGMTDRYAIKEHRRIYSLDTF